jgi:hypothetical protein
MFVGEGTSIDKPVGGSASRPGDRLADKVTARAARSSKDLRKFDDGAARAALLSCLIQPIGERFTALRGDGTRHGAGGHFYMRQRSLLRGHLW